MESIIRAIEIYPDRVRLLDQRKLPLVEEYVECRTYQEVAEAIRTMVVRGAPAIGVTAAGGIALGVQHLQSGSSEEITAQFETICTTLAQTRPTAVNLFWAIDRMRACARQYYGAPLPQFSRRCRPKPSVCGGRISTLTGALVPWPAAGAARQHDPYAL